MATYALNQEEIGVINTGSTKVFVLSVWPIFLVKESKLLLACILLNGAFKCYMENTVSVNSNIPHFHTEGLTKKHVHDVDEVHKEDFSPAGCLCA